jgi:hypothetical protein
MMQAFIVEVLSGLIVAEMLEQLNRMTAQTQHSIRLSAVLIATGAFMYLLSPYLGRAEYSVQDYLFLGGAAMYFWFNRRNKPNFT